MESLYVQVLFTSCDDVARNKRKSRFNKTHVTRVFSSNTFTLVAFAKIPVNTSVIPQADHPMCSWLIIVGIRLC